MPRKTKESKESEKIEKKPSTKKVSKKTSTNTKVSNKNAKSKVITPTVTKSKVAKAKKSTVKKSTTKKTTAKKTSSKVSKNEKPKLVEYYDLPLSYNQTTVKILYQTPTTLFVYWEISGTDADNYRKIYGDNFFENTKPVLIVHNNTLNYSFEIEINDFANSWYFNVNDSKSTYSVELGRRPISDSPIKDNYIYISSSNTIETPNDEIMFEKYIPDHVLFRNIKNNSTRLVSLKDLLKSTPIASKLSKLYNIKIEDLYKAIYNNETTGDLYKLMNPSSISSSF